MFVEKRTVFFPTLVMPQAVQRCSTYSAQWVLPYLAGQILTKILIHCGGMPLHKQNPPTKIRALRWSLQTVLLKNCGFEKLLCGFEVWQGVCVILLEPAVWYVDDCEERRKDWVVKPVTQAKHYDYIAGEAHHNDMSTSTLKMAIKELQPSPQLPFNIADASKLAKSDVISEHQRR